jgi:hypothetical protein
MRKCPGCGFLHCRCPPHDWRRAKGRKMTEDEFRRGVLLTEKQADAVYGPADPGDIFHPRNLCLTQEQQKQEPGLRTDAGKTRWDLLPFDALEQVAQVSSFGSRKYAARNWELGMSWSRMVGSLLRHLYARMRGERLDPDSNLPHLAHAAWNALALCAYDLRGVGRDDLKECAHGPIQPPAPAVQPEPRAPGAAG